MPEPVKRVYEPLAKPTCKPILDGYCFEWEKPKIFVNVTRIKQHTDGRVTGEVKVSRTGTDPNKPSHLHQAQFNFTSSGARKSLATSLADRSNGVDWGAALEQLCVGTLERYRAGEPVSEELIDDSPLVAPPFLLAPYFLEGTPSILYGEKGVSKSTIALYLYICLNLPWGDNPLGLEVPMDPVKALICDWEQEKKIVDYYSRRIRLGHSLPPFYLNYLHCEHSLNDEVQKIQQTIVEKQAQVIIIDSLGAACGGDLNKPEMAIEFFGALRQLKTKEGNPITSIILAQQSKNPENKKTSIFGSSYFTYYARSILEVAKGENSSPEIVDVALFHRFYNYGKLQKPFGFSINYLDNQGIKFEARHIDIHDFMEKMSSSRLVLDYLQGGPKIVKDIVDYCGVKSSSIRTVLARLEKRKEIVKLEDGRWGLRSNRQDEPGAPEPPRDTP